MKKPVSTLCIAATLAMSFNSSAQADWGRHDRGYRDYQPMHHQHRGGSGWVGPAAILAIAGLAIGSAVASQSYYAPHQSIVPRRRALCPVQITVHGITVVRPTCTIPIPTPVRKAGKLYRLNKKRAISARVLEITRQQQP